MVDSLYNFSERTGPFRHDITKLYIVDLNGVGIEVQYEQVQSQI